MRHRSKHLLFDTHQKKKDHRTPSTLTKKSLHSKSTYFYHGGDSGLCDHNSTNEFRWTPAHCEQATDGNRNACANRTRSSRETNSYSRIVGHKLAYVVPSVCSLAFLLGGIVAINPQGNVNHAYADDMEGRATGNASISLSFGENASFTTPASVEEVAYITNTFTVNANKQTGYTITLSAMNGSGTALHGKDNYGAVIAGVGTNKTPSQFEDNTWGYSYSVNPNADKTQLSYSSMPADSNGIEILRNTTLTGIENETNTYLLAFAAKFGKDTPADHYIGNYILSVVGTAFNPDTYTLTYDANGNNVTNLPTAQSCMQETANSTCNVTIASGTPTRDGYTFLGWGDAGGDNNTVNASYSAGNTISLSANKIIHAVWQANDITGLTYMQDMTSAACTATPEGTEVKLKDKRDDHVYYVTKLKDGNCWMTQNLAYNGGGSRQCTVSGTSCSGWPSSGTPSIYAVGSHTDGNHSSKGNYYSFGAANTGGSTDGDTASVCPEKWQLPTSNNGDTDKSFEHLLRQYNWAGNSTKPEQIGSKGITGSPLYFQYGGYLYSGQLDCSGSDGYYWSSTPNGSDYGYYLYFYVNNIVNPSSNTYRYNGFSVRCVAK